MRHHETEVKDAARLTAAASNAIPVSAIASKDILELVARGRRLRAQFVHDALVRAGRACARALHLTRRPAKGRPGFGHTVTG